MLLEITLQIFSALNLKGKHFVISLSQKKMGSENQKKWDGNLIYDTQPGKRTHITNWKIHPFYSWINQLFQIGPWLPVRKL